jgi:hypothetical protein
MQFWSCNEKVASADAFCPHCGTRFIYKNGVAKAITATTETPRGERSHAVGAHVAEGHGWII